MFIKQTSKTDLPGFTPELIQQPFLSDQLSESKDKKRKKLKKNHKKLKKAYKRQSAELQKLKDQENTKKLFWKMLSNTAPKALQLCSDILNVFHSEKMIDKQLSIEEHKKKRKKKHKKNKNNLVA